MKKTLIAVAALAAAGGAFAQSSVSLYGRLDLGMSQIKNTTPSIANAAGAITTAGTTNTVTSAFGAQNIYTTSRLGVKGAEDLGGGTKALFNYELAIDPDNSSAVGIGKTRLGNVGLTGGFGTVTLGTFLNAFDTVRGYSKATAGTAGFPGGSATDNALALVGTTAISGRSQNTIAYTTPNFGGLTAGMTLSSEQNKTTTDATSTTVASTTDDKTQVVGLTLGYENGPLSTRVAYAQGKTDTLSAATLSAAAVSGTSKLNDIALAASYDLGIAKPYVIAEQAKSTASGNSTALTDLAKYNTTGKGQAVTIGSGFTFGAFEPWIEYTQAKDKGTSCSVVGAAVSCATAPGYTAAKGKAWQVGSKYNVSKRTFAYGAYGNEDKTGSGSTANPAITTKEKGFAVGLVHQF